MALTDTDRRTLATWQDKLANQQNWRFLRNDRPECRGFTEFIEACQNLVPNLVITGEVIPETALPGLVIGENWRIHAVPSGKKLELLEEILLARDGQWQALAPAVRSRWEKLPVAPELTVFIAPECPFCPQMVRQLIPLTMTPPKAVISLIDASLFLELSREHGIKAVPTVIVNEVYRLTGAFQLSELLDLAEKADPAELPASVLERMLVEGQANVLGDWMLAEQMIFPPVPGLLLHPEINIRLGAMVSLETVGEEHPELVEAMLPEIWQLSSGSDLAVRGDVIYLIGEWGSGTWMESLAAVKKETAEPELQEAVDEALTKLREKAG